MSLTFQIEGSIGTLPACSFHTSASLPPSLVRSHHHVAASRPGIEPSEPPERRAIKRGYRSFQEPQACGVSFQDLPAWLWTLRAVEWSHIYISVENATQLREHHPQLHSQLSSRLVEVSSSLSIEVGLPEAKVWWISGSEDYCRVLVTAPSVRGVAWLTRFGRRPRHEGGGSKVQWLNLHHSKVGGATLCRATFRIEGFDNQVNIAPDLSRSLSHVVKYSIRSTPCDAELNVPHYKLMD